MASINFKIVSEESLKMPWRLLSHKPQQLKNLSWKWKHAAKSYTDWEKAGAKGV